MNGRKTVYPPFGMDYSRECITTAKTLIIEGSPRGRNHKSRFDIYELHIFLHIYHVTLGEEHKETQYSWQAAQFCFFCQCLVCNIQRECSFLSQCSSPPVPPCSSTPRKRTGKSIVPEILDQIQYYPKWPLVDAKSHLLRSICHLPCALHAFSHSSLDENLLLLPPHPPYRKGEQEPLLKSK